MPTANKVHMEKKKEMVRMSLVNRYQSRQATIRLKKLAMPPMVGIGVICSFLSSGTSKRWKRLTTLIRGGMTSIAIMNAVTKARMLNLKAEKFRLIWFSSCSIADIGTGKISINAY